MDRLQKKCVVASASLHGLLAGALLFGSAFLAPSRKAPDLDVLTIIPATLVDAPVSNPGGNPKVTQPPPLAPQVKPEPPAPVPKPEPKPEPVVKPPAPAAKEPVAVKPPDETDFTKPATSKHAPSVNPKMVTRKPDPRAKSEDPDSDAAERAQQKAAANARKRALAGALAGISGVASSSTSVEIPGPGGQAFANYAQVVKSVYTQAWIVPADVDDDEATTRASVTINKDGTVDSARIIGPSRNAAVDASVSRTLKSVTFVAPFPAGAKEDKRTFTISFNLKAKRQLG